MDEINPNSRYKVLNTQLYDKIVRGDSSYIISGDIDEFHVDSISEEDEVKIQELNFSKGEGRYLDVDLEKLETALVEGCIEEK